MGLSTMLALSEADLPVNCRTVVFSEARTPLACVMITRNTLNTPGLQLDTINWGTVGQLSADTNTDTDHGQDTVYNDLLKSWVVNPVSTGNGLNPTVADAASALDPDLLPGACRWDFERSNKLGSDQACLCPATVTTCAIGRKGCYWYEIPDEPTIVPTFACINTAERFHLLAKLLKKRGKKDFAIKIRYGATPARGQLPLGPYGPAIIGGGAFSSEGLAKQTLAKNLLSRFSNPGWTLHQSPYSPHFPSPPHYPSPPQYAPPHQFPVRHNNYATN